MPSTLDDARVTHPLSGSQQRRDSDASQGRRRSSAASGAGRFSSLNHERNQMYGDPARAARRESFHDQRKETGWVGSLWNNWFRGPPHLEQQQRRGSDADSGSETSRSSSITEQVQKTSPKTAKHITGTGSAQAVFRSQYPPTNK